MKRAGQGLRELALDGLEPLVWCLFLVGLVVALVAIASENKRERARRFDDCMADKRDRILCDIYANGVRRR